MSVEPRWANSRLLLIWLLGMAFALLAGVAVSELSFRVVGPSTVAAGASIKAHWDLR